ncbi:hypothetical protein [Spirochaeta cellobiosiphila]|uniref:hypothetical protein n=1 Tax=Spirochaeta cellobiosiphila TaxID=504483 RepID=UPI00041EFCA1|nr:hypothetical protein [Spirochaeta cellobiosiphila]
MLIKFIKLTLCVSVLLFFSCEIVNDDSATQTDKRDNVKSVVDKPSEDKTSEDKTSEDKTSEDKTSEDKTSEQDTFSISGTITIESTYERFDRKILLSVLDMSLYDDSTGALPPSAKTISIDYSGEESLSYTIPDLETGSYYIMASMDDNLNGQIDNDELCGGVGFDPLTYTEDTDNQDIYMDYYNKTKTSSETYLSSRLSIKSTMSGGGGTKDYHGSRDETVELKGSFDTYYGDAEHPDETIETNIHYWYINGEKVSEEESFQKDFLPGTYKIELFSQNTVGNKDYQTHTAYISE